jgi:hypothetical protein
MINKSTRQIALMLILALSVFPALVAQTSGGGISGTVSDSAGNPLSATVTINSFGNVAGVPYTTAAGTDGGFSFSGLTPGAYRLCATAASSTYVDGCLWHTGTPIRIAAGSSVNGRRIVLEKTGNLSVRLVDPASLLSQSTPGTATSYVLVGVVTDTKIFLGAQVSNTTATERDHLIPVPVDRPVWLRLVVKGLSLTDSTGAAAGGADIGVQG